MLIDIDIDRCQRMRLDVHAIATFHKDGQKAIYFTEDENRFGAAECTILDGQIKGVYNLGYKMVVYLDNKVKSISIDDFVTEDEKAIGQKLEELFGERYHRLEIKN